MKHIKNFAHRGARSLAPENTMQAIARAWRIGTDGVEVDVQVTRDGRLVLHHDRTLQRTTNVADVYPDRAAHALSTFSYAELQEADAGSWFIATDPFGQIKAGKLPAEERHAFPDCRIPLLAELLQYLRDKKWRINLELKQPPAPMKQFPLVEAVIGMIETEQVDREKVIISSFHHEYLRLAAKSAPDLEINALIGKNAVTRNNWGDFEFRIYNANATYVTRTQVQSAMEKGCIVNLYTVNKSSDMERYIRWGVDTLITDFPQRLKRLQQTGR